jgi:hypothetical protein
MSNTMAYCIIIVVRCIFVIGSFWTGLKCGSSLDLTPLLMSLGGRGLLESLPLVPERMVDSAAMSLGGGGLPDTLPLVPERMATS